MSNTELFSKFSQVLKAQISFLEDKPEENLVSTLKALWLCAADFPVSAEKAVGLKLPELTTIQKKKLEHLFKQRINNIPLAHITKRQSFMGLEFITDKRALIPRKETEILGNEALKLSFEFSEIYGKVNVIDVCCGAGNLGIAISKLNPLCKVHAADISSEAVELACENVKFLNQDSRVRVIVSDMLAEFETNEFFGKIDLIICNPPYISNSKVVKMHPEISDNEPSLAFNGGMMGLKVIQKLIHEAPRFLSPGGWLCFEVGDGQGEFISKMCKKTQLYQKIQLVLDISGNIRVILSQKSTL